MNTQPTRRIEKRPREISNRYSPNVKIKNSDTKALEKKTLDSPETMKIVFNSAIPRLRQLL
jgi:hypothetical protein